MILIFDEANFFKWTVSLCLKHLMLKYWLNMQTPSQGAATAFTSDYGHKNQKSSLLAAATPGSMFHIIQLFHGSPSIA
ncbi:hypothetical protein SAMN04515679_4729 [Pelosinus fermentans]|jgi:hypothetical protein|uniref:Uncharacterized protein n=3 Tax=Sporomusaceae TaxID=1843490 RepID=I8RHI6_9FIRM|nr:hypothetical protein [Pelosinus fermentans]EIW17350.1 hypothetical protein FB4_4099 [Pelosinus fermentans B4]EIW23409.1 hypothetical protein FA11_4101 [Pelosinus fermentans A11]OAM96520.1 hypothetical protein FR7_04544 [Pelosinus fermentans DSM 17108]SDR40985.1 hypothetical protein SAMN04515679_4729 [Pelosinus fermentans]